MVNTLQTYSAANEYPLGSSECTKTSKNSTISIEAFDEIYAMQSTYFLRVVPDFALWDVLSNREFIVYTYAFT